MAHQGGRGREEAHRRPPWHAGRACGILRRPRRVAGSRRRRCRSRRPSPSPGLSPARAQAAAASAQRSGMVLRTLTEEERPPAFQGDRQCPHRRRRSPRPRRGRAKRRAEEDARLKREAEAAARRRRKTTPRAAEEEAAAAPSPEPARRVEADAKSRPGRRPPFRPRRARPSTTRTSSAKPRP